MHVVLFTLLTAIAFGARNHAMQNKNLQLRRTNSLLLKALKELTADDEKAVAQAVCKPGRVVGEKCEGCTRVYIGTWADTCEGCTQKRHYGNLNEGESCIVQEKEDGTQCGISDDTDMVCKGATDCDSYGTDSDCTYNDCEWGGGMCTKKGATDCDSYGTDYDCTYNDCEWGGGMCTKKTETLVAAETETCPVKFVFKRLGCLRGISKSWGDGHDVCDCAKKCGEPHHSGCMTFSLLGGKCWTSAKSDAGPCSENTALHPYFEAVFRLKLLSDEAGLGISNARLKKANQALREALKSLN